jgi:hypothetical protein
MQYKNIYLSNISNIVLILTLINDELLDVWHPSTSLRSLLSIDLTINFYWGSKHEHRAKLNFDRNKGYQYVVRPCL